MKMKTLNPEYLKRMREIVSTSPYFELLSMKLLDAGVGYS
ncbi:MAG: PaaI family thioesterase, partial [Deltaproteobacteria bacterium]|nr:PaaI family thioesterase [Deltaproteobacteria bacterium]